MCHNAVHWWLTQYGFNITNAFPFQQAAAVYEY
jgi:hypothetical protein